MILVTEPAARWLLHQAERDPALAFNTFPPFFCKCCDRSTPLDEQRAHVRAHRVELDKATAKRRREALRALKQANRLRREANHAA